MAKEIKTSKDELTREDRLKSLIDSNNLYVWKGFDVLNAEEILKRWEEDGLQDCLLYYPDFTERYIEYSPEDFKPSLDDIESHIACGGYIVVENDKKPKFCNINLEEIGRFFNDGFLSYFRFIDDKDNSYRISRDITWEEVEEKLSAGYGIGCLSSLDYNDFIGKLYAKESIKGR